MLSRRNSLQIQLHGRLGAKRWNNICHANINQKKPSHVLGVIYINTDKMNLAAECYQQLRGCRVTKSCPTLVTPWTAECQAPLSSTIFRSLCKFMSIKSVIISNHLIFCCPLLLLPSIFPSIRVFSSNSTLCIMWPKHWSFGFSISPSSESSGLISLRIDWFDLLAVQGTLKSLLQHHNLKASILQHSAFFMAHLSHPYMTAGKTKALTKWTFVGKVMSLLFNTLSRFVTAFPPRSKCL